MMTPSLYGYLTVFHAIVEQGNLSKASQSLELSVPSVSNTLKALEKNWVCRCFTALPAN